MLFPSWPEVALLGTEGQRVVVDEAMMIGRQPGLRLSLPDRRVAQQHVRLLRVPSGRVLAIDQTVFTGTFLNGAPMQRALLSDGDVLSVGPYELEVRITPALPRPPDVLDELTAVVVADPDSDAAWRVLADRLQELGSPLGHRIERDDRSTEALESLADEAANDRLVLEWSHGFLTRARIRRDADDAVVFALLAHPLATFLRRLEVEQPPKGDGLGVLPLPALRSVQVGPWHDDGAPWSVLPRAAQLAREGAPLLSDRRTLRLVSAWLERDDGHRAPLTPGDDRELGGFEVLWRAGWVVTSPDALFSVNGRTTLRRALDLGDVIRAGDREWTFRGHAEALGDET
jgi:predicted component of type VI protein secretion system